MNKDIFEMFSPSGSDAILVSRTKGGADIPMGTPLTGASNTRVYEKLSIFFTNISLYLRNGYTHAAGQFVRIEFSFHPYNI